MAASANNNVTVGLVWMGPASWGGGREGYVAHAVNLKFEGGIERIPAPFEKSMQLVLTARQVSSLSIDVVLSESHPFLDDEKRELDTRVAFKAPSVIENGLRYNLVVRTQNGLIFSAQIFQEAEVLTLVE